MARTVFETWDAEEPAPQGATFLERALERALAGLDRDTDLSEGAREAAKAALAAALAAEIRDVLAGERTPARGRPARVFVPLGGFPQQAETERPGLFRSAGAVLGVDEVTEADVRLTRGAATWLRLMPAHDPGRTWSAAALRAALRRPRPDGVLPIFADARGTGELKAGDGVGVYAKSPSPTETSGVVFAFRTGEIWSVDTYVQDALSQQQPNPAILTLEPELTAAFEAYVDLLERLGAPKPYRWIIGMDGLMGRSIALPDGDLAGLLRGECVLGTVVSEGQYDGSMSAEAAIQPFFEDLYRACSTPVG